MQDVGAVVPRRGGTSRRSRVAGSDAVGRLATASSAPADVTAPVSTRERILEVALDLFVERGVDKTSLREIAEQLGITKAAIYYHFAGKDDIVMALHLRLHEIGHRAIARLGEAPSGPESIGRLLDEMIDEMLANRKIFLMHERNRSALEALHSKDHSDDHDDLVERISMLVSSPSLPLVDRVRIGCAIGAVMTGLVFSSQLGDETPSEELAGALRDVVADLVGPAARARVARRAARAAEPVPPAAASEPGAAAALAGRSGRRVAAERRA